MINEQNNIACNGSISEFLTKWGGKCNPFDFLYLHNSSEILSLHFVKSKTAKYLFALLNGIFHLVPEKFSVLSVYRVFNVSLWLNQSQ